MTISTGQRVIGSATRYGRINWPEPMPKGSCRVCGCTERHGCPEGCSWIVAPRDGQGYGICDLCLDRCLVLLETPRADFATTLAGEILRNAVHPNLLALALYNVRGEWRRRLLRKRLNEMMRSRVRAPDC